ncbi:hypothetical protein [Leptospira brenneri]|uniref:hypothetical protein n=1 Tax=Leptospira brenneri TaxID=2023182 RepID=UPI0013FD1989|nr:hypothetical protein [Leptospira brenneri]
MAITRFALCSSFDGSQNREELEAFWEITEIFPSSLLHWVRHLTKTIQKGEL